MVASPHQKRNRARQKGAPQGCTKGDHLNILPLQWPPIFIRHRPTIHAPRTFQERGRHLPPCVGCEGCSARLEIYTPPRYPQPPPPHHLWAPYSARFPLRHSSCGLSSSKSHRKIKLPPFDRFAGGKLRKTSPTRIIKSHFYKRQENFISLSRSTNSSNRFSEWLQQRKASSSGFRASSR